MSKKKYKACIYARLSKDDDDIESKKESNSISNQKALIRDYLSRMSDVEIVAEKVDDGFSGVNFDRPGFKEMMDLIKAGKVNCVVVKDLSRLGRNYIDCGNYIERVFPFLKVRFIAINDYIDTAERQNDTNMVVPFKNIMNDSYAKDISTKVRSQLEIKRKKGEFIGAFATYGYMKDPDNHNHLIIDEEAAGIVRQIYKWRIEGMNQYLIAHKLNEKGVLCPMEYKIAKGYKIQKNFKVNEQAKWSYITVTRILTNEVYIGALVQGKEGKPNYKVKKIMRKDESEWIRVENAHEAIVTYNDFMIVKDLLKKDTRRAPSEEKVYLYSGLLYCGDCGYAMCRKIVPSGKNKYAYYVCSNNKYHKMCSAHSISEKMLNEAVLCAIKKHIEAIDDIENIYQYIDELPQENRNVFDYDTQIERASEEIENCQKYKLKLYEHFEDGTISQSEYFEFKNRYNQKIDDKQQLIRNLEKEKAEAMDGNRKDLSWISIFKNHVNLEELDRKSIIEITFRYKDAFTRALETVDAIEKKLQAASGTKGEIGAWQEKAENKTKNYA